MLGEGIGASQVVGWMLTFEYTSNTGFLGQNKHVLASKTSIEVLAHNLLSTHNTYEVYSTARSAIDMLLNLFIYMYI